MIEDWTKYPNFSEGELACPCCGEAEMNRDFMGILQAIRTDYGKPMNVTSGYRCETHNKALRGGPEHPAGQAVDILVANPDAMELVALAVKYGLPRVGISQRGDRPRFIHLGGSSDLPKAIWSY